VGIIAKIEKLSQSTVRKRIDKFEYDMFWVAWGADRLRDPESQWHSLTADQEASDNYPGVKDPALDSLIDLQKTMMNMDARIEILKEIDRRLNEIVPYVFLWWPDHNRLLYWNKFGTPKYVYDKFDTENKIITYWWLDKAKETGLKQAMAEGSDLPRKKYKVHYSE